MTKVFINNAWIELSYSVLHDSYGITLSKSDNAEYIDPITFESLTGWRNSGEYWVSRDSQWYSELECPYFISAAQISRFYIDKIEVFNSFLKNGDLYVDYNDQFILVSSLYTDYGYTETPSTIWDSDEGVPWAWYNPVLELYWNDRTKGWTENPPIIVPDIPPEVLPNPIPLVEIDTFSDIDPPIVFSGLRPFTFHLESPNWTHGQLLKPIDIDTDFNNPLAVYKDVLDENLTLWVNDPDGVDFQDVHYDFADPITPVDKFTVMVDPVGEDTFYYQNSTYKFGYLYDSVSSILKHYWKEDNSRYLTEQDLLELGFTRTSQSKVFITNDNSQIQDIVEIWYNEVHGYYYDGVLYPTEQDLNNAGYYLVEKVTQELYVGPYDWGTWYYDYNKTKNSTSFTLTSNYVMNLWLDSERSQPFLYDGKNWKFDIVETAKYKVFSNPISSLDQMPTSTTTGSYYTLPLVMTQSGNPITPLVQSDIGLQMRGHISINYYSLVTASTGFRIVASYWKYMEKVLSFTNTQLADIEIDLPQSISAEQGSSVILPTMSGEYESGGKIWKPSAWDIGAFGDSYTLNADTEAHLIFEEAQSELTAYFTTQGAAATGDKSMTMGTFQLYDSSGNILLSDDNHTYTFVKAYDYAGNEATVPSAVYAPVFNNSGTLCLAMHPGSFTAYCLTYTVSDNT